jgi:hypothetical protein
MFWVMKVCFDHGFSIPAVLGLCYVERVLRVDMMVGFPQPR